MVRSAFGSAYYPLSRFQRIEAGMRFANVDDAILRINEPYNPTTGFATDDPFLETDNLPGVTYAQPSAALVFDNSLFGYVGPVLRPALPVELARTVGDWSFAQVTADYRRYDRIIGPIVFASRLLYFGRIGRDAREFRIYAGSTDLIRGNTSGSYRRNECLNADDPGAETGCSELDRLVGTQIGVASAELRFPILNPSFGVPAAFPPHRGRPLLRHRPGLGQHQHAPLGSPGRRRSGPGADPAPHSRACRCGPTCSASQSPAGLLDSAGPPAGQRTLDLQPGADLLGAGRRDGESLEGLAPSRARDRLGITRASLMPLGMTAADRNPPRPAPAPLPRRPLPTMFPP